MTHRLSNRCREEKKKNFQLSPHRLFTLSGLRPLNNIELASTSLFFISFTLTAQIWAQFKQEHINGSINDVRLRTRASGEMVLMSEQMWCHDSQMTFSSAISERVVIFFGTMVWKILLAMTMPCETIDAGFIMRHTYVCHGVWSLIGLDTNLHVKKKTMKDIPQTLKKAICLTCLRLSRLTE